MKALTKPPCFYHPPPNLIHPFHHSVSDWDKNADATYTLDATQYVSAPKSLRLGGPGSTGCDTQFLCRQPDTFNLPQGRVVTWHRTTFNDGRQRVPFRNQSAFGGAEYLNTYYIQYLMAEALLMLVLSGTPSIIDAIDLVTAVDTWYKDRITWWNGQTPDSVPALTVMLERWIDTAWVQQGDWLYDTNNRWKDSAKNRCGVGGGEKDTEYYWFDDTEIWAPS